MSGVRRGERWEQPVDPTELANVIEVVGSDVDLASAVERSPGRLLRFRPDVTSQLAATLGLGARGALVAAQAGQVVAVDALRVTLDTASPRIAVASVCCGIAPDRTRAWHRRQAVEIAVGSRRARARVTGVVALNAQHHHDNRLVTSGHPGDGRFEVLWIGLAPGARAELRRRIPSGAHLPHPDIGQATGRSAVIEWPVAVPVALDGVAAGSARRVEIEVLGGVVRLLV